MAAIINMCSTGIRRCVQAGPATLDDVTEIRFDLILKIFILLRKNV